MSLKNQTKLLFAQTLEEMLQTMPMDKVRVVELIRRAGTIPQSFYYHFHDKYELVAWKFLYDFSNTYIDEPQQYSVESISKNLTDMYQHRNFYQKTYTERSQNSIDQYIQSFNVKTAVESIEAFYQEPVTSDQLAEIKYHSYGMMGLFKEWIQNGNSDQIKKLAEFQYAHVPTFLKKAYQNFDFKKSDVFK